MMNSSVLRTALVRGSLFTGGMILAGVFFAGCGSNKDAFGSNAATEMMSQLKEYARSERRNANYLPHTIKKYVAEEKRTLPALGEQCMDFKQSRREEMQSLRYTLKRYVESQ